MAEAKEDLLIKNLLFHSEADNAGHVARLIRNLPEWDHFERRAAVEQISPLVYYRLKSLGLDQIIPSDVLRNLKREYLLNLERNLAILGEARRVLNRFREEGLDFVVLKGLALAECVYPHLAMRQMSDVDILVRKKRIPAVDRILSDLSYSTVDGTPEEALAGPPGYLASLEYRKNRSLFLAFHIHWHLVNTSTPADVFSEGIDLERVWEKAVPARIAGVDAKILHPVHQVLFLCEHGLRAGHSFDRLILVYDIHSVIRRFPEAIDWDEVLSQARAFGLSSLLYAGLSVVRHHAPGTLPDGVVERARPETVSLWERIFLLLQKRGIRKRGLSILVYLGMHRGVPSRAAFLFRILFPPAAVLSRKSYAGRQQKTGFGRYAARLRETAAYAFSALRHLFFR